MKSNLIFGISATLDINAAWLRAMESRLHDSISASLGGILREEGDLGMHKDYTTLISPDRHDLSAVPYETAPGPTFFHHQTPLESWWPYLAVLSRNPEVIRIKCEFSQCSIFSAVGSI